MIVRTWILLICFFSASTRLFAQGGSEPQDVKPELLADHRQLLTIAFSVVFVLIIGYLVLSYRKNAHLAEEVAFLKKRVDA